MNQSSILIVEDNLGFAFSLGEILKDEGYLIETRNSGEEALELLRQQSFDLVLLDMKLPRMSGTDVLFEIRSTRPDSRVVMMSGHSVIDLMAQAVDGGFHRAFYHANPLESLRSMVAEMPADGLVLLADQQPDQASRVEQMLADAGRRVCLADGGADLLATVESGAVDALVLNQPLPIIDGLEVYWTLRKHGHALLTVIVVTYPQAEPITIERLNQFPICGYFVKPFDPMELIPALESIIG